MKSGKIKAVYRLFKEAGSAWMGDNVPSMSAALAFYTILSLAPVLIIAMAVAALVFGHRAAEGEILQQLQSMLGEMGARAVQAMIQSADRPKLGIIASAIGIGTILIGATGVFVELQNALDKIWQVERRSKSVWVGVIRERFFAFTLVLGAGVLLMVALVSSSALGAAARFMGRLHPGREVLLEAVAVLLSFGVIALLLMLIFKFVPDTKIAWNDVWIGATIASLLFTLGKALMGMYLARSTSASAYGAAASILIFLVWVYYSAQIVLLGAEVTHVYANKLGSRSGPAFSPGENSCRD
ncbi:MAG TPA: YihY/virulence factor BrkB family protein [Terriglobia bacterium]|nr:YihY/virulence factor BrkB family protein [Terriglobia bacterium]